MIYSNPRHLPNYPYDVAVVGSGTAGTTLAHHNANSGLRAIILESQYELLVYGFKI
jgi:2-polyprenyl-6-methoxyphenol hydroxylase-like FAD-dependent oxidoreductase